MNDPTPAPDAVPWENTYLGRLFEHSDAASRREIPAVRRDLIRYLADPVARPDLVATLAHSLAAAVCWWVNGSSMVSAAFQPPIRDAVSNMMAKQATTTTSPTAEQLDTALFNELPEYMRKLVYPDRYPDYSPIEPTAAG